MIERLGMKLYTLYEVAEILSVTPRTMSTYLKNGRIPGQKIRGRWMITEENLRAFMSGKPPASGG